MPRLVKEKNVNSKRRQKLRTEFWPDQRAWGGSEEVGWFAGPRTLPYVLTALRSKKVSGSQDPSTVYLELMSRHMADGIIEMEHEEDHANAAGYFGPRAVRSWRDRMKILERNGFIKCAKKGSRQFAYVLLGHPAIAMHELHTSGKVDDELWTAYRARQIETKEPTFEDLVEEERRVV